MKILQIGKFYAPYRGGIETLLQNLSEGLVAAGDSVTVVCSTERARGVAELLAGVRVRRTTTFGKLFSQPLSPSLPLRIHAEARRADIVHVHCPNPLAEMAALTLPRDVPLVASWHSDVVRQRRLARLYAAPTRAFLRRVDRVVVATPHHIEHSSALRAFRERCRVIPFGIDAQPFAVGPNTLGAAEAQRHRFGGSYVLFVGRLVGYKGVDVLIEALRDVPETRLVIAGDGPLRGELESAARRHGVAERTHFVGAASERELVELYHGCSVFALPSVTRAEAFGIVLIEAMACGKPVISTRLDSGVMLVNQAEVTGLVVEPGKPRELAGAIRRLLGDPALLAACGARARARFLAEFSRDVMIERIRALYAELLPRPVARG